LTALLTQDYDPAHFEVIVVDGQSEDETVAIVRRLQGRFPNLKLLFNPRRFSSAARNVGVRHSSGDYCVVVDGHCTIPDRFYLRNLARAFEESGADCLGRPQPLSVDGATPFQQSLALARQSRLGHNPGSDIFASEERFVPPQNVAVAYRREVFERVGLFDEKFDACEDVEFNYRVDRAGLRCFFTPAILVRYHPRASLPGLIYQMFRYGRGRCRLARKHPASLTLPALVPACFLAWLAAGFALGCASAWAAAAYCLSLLLYLALVLAGSAWLGRRAPAALPRLPVIFLAIHVGFGWGFLREAAAALLARRGP
ncbi:MAG TPA: glycosyltransferase family 2 protein, partial [Gemmataceae bacterium]